MNNNTYFRNFARLVTLVFFSGIALQSCKKDAKPDDGTSGTPDNTQTSPDTSPIQMFKISSAKYQWRDLSIIRKNQNDTIYYNPASGNIDSTITEDFTYGTSRTKFTYNGTNLVLNSDYHEKYEFDNLGRVIYHSFDEVQQGYNIASIQRYSYDADGYLNKIQFSTIFAGGAERPYSTINYEVKNGNMIKYTLTNISDGAIGRQYNFNYNTSQTAYTPASLFAPVLANKTYLSIEKYLNYGRSSKNLLNSVDYKIVNLDKTVSSGTFTAVTKLDALHRLTGLTLDGPELTSFPSDNLSPLPRGIKISYK